MADRTFNDVKINLTLKPQTARANVSSSKEDLAVQMGKIQQWYPGLNNYATCDTAAATAIKTVDCPGFELTTGTVVIVKFTVTNTAAVADLQLNVNGTGAKGIKYRNANLSAASVLTANRIYAMLYDGTYWQIIGDLVQDGRYLPMAGGTMDNNAEVTIPNGSHSSKYTGYGMYHYIGAGNGWARGINVNSTDDTRIGSLGMYGTSNSTEPTYAYFGKTYDDAWYQLYKNSFRINDTEENGFQFRYKPSSLSSGYNGSFISLFPGETYGYGIVVGHTHGGLTVVGGGESASAFTNTAFDSTTSPYGSTVFQFDSEALVLTADNSIWFVSGANGLSTSAHTDWTNVKTALFDTNGSFRPSIDNKGSIGTSSYKWANMYATTFNGNLTGNVTGQIDVTTTNPTSGTTYYGIFAAAQSGVNNMRANDGFRVLSLQGTTSTYGYDYLLLGNDTASGITGNKYGGIRLYSSNTSYFQLTSGYQDEPTSFRFAHSTGATGADFSPETTNKYDFGTSSLKWRNVYATTLNGELKGTISTATTATTQDATNTSTKVATTAHVTNKLYLAGVYYNSQSDFASAPWGKVWEYNINAESAHRHISFILEQGFQGTNAPNTLGILMVHIATNASKEYNGGHVFWLAASSDLNKDDIAVTYQGSNACIIQIWIKTTVRYQSFHLHPLYSGVLGSASAIMGTYSSPTSGAANYAGTLIASSYTTLNNPTKMLKTIHASRPTSANFESSNSTGVTFALATSSMTTAKPMSDGHIMNFEWDNGGKWGAQLFLPDADAAMVEYRTQSNATDWADRNWIPLLDSISGVGKDGYIAYPSDGQYTASQSSVTGALVITLPFGMTAIMLSFIVDVYNYADNTTVSYRVSGYTYNSDSKWYSCTALCIGSYAGALSNLTVRFGHNGTKAQVQIGETTTVWAWPQVRVRNIMLGHTTASADKTFITNRKNWTVSFVTTNISNVTKTIQNTNIGKTLAASATQTGTVGGKGIPVYLNSGTITACSTPASGAWWSTSNALVPQISTAGVLEIGKYIDLHATAASTNNFDYRFEAVSTKEMMFSSTGTDNVLTLNTAGYNQIRFKTTATDKSYTALGIVSYPLSASGQTMLFQCGGNMVIGGGEFAASAYARKDSTGETQVGYDNIVTTEREKLYLGADTEVQIIANAQNLATYSNNDHVVWKFQTTGQLITPDVITDTLDLQHTMVNQSVRSDSNCVTLAQWIVNGAASTTYRPGISFHNTGGDSTDKGAIILRPYHHNTVPWGTNVGLYIGKGILKLDGTNVSLEGHTHETLTCKSVTATTVNNTAGCFFFKGDNLVGNASYDFVGIQADAGNDKFQLMPNGGGSLMYRQNDTGGTNSSNWSTWNGILTASSVTTDSYLSVAATTSTIGSSDGAFTYNSGVKISHKAYTSKTSGLYKITVDAAGHVSATASVAKGDIPALDYVPNTTAGVNAAINLLSTGDSVPQDNDYYISQYVNGGTSTTTYHRRPVSALYSYIANKLQHNAGLNMAHLFSGWNTVGWHRVLSLPCSSTASGRIIRTIELTCIRNYNNGQPEVFSVRMIGLFNATEGFEILYSKSNSASTQYIPKIRMTKSSDGKTLYVDFYYNSTNNNGMTVYCTWLDPDITNKGSYSITWGNGAVVDDSLTVVASLDIPRDITGPGTGFYYVIGTQNASTGSWTGTIPASKLHNGLTIAYYLPYASAASTNVTLNLTLSTGATTGAINVYYTGTTRMTTHYGAGSTIILTYFEAGAISVGGTATTDARWTHSDYNTNTNTYVTQSNSTTTNYRALLLGYNDSTTPSSLTTSVTNQAYVSANIYAQPSTGLIACSGRKLITPFAIQTGSSKKAKITLQTLMTWLITTKKYIHSGIYEHVVLQTTWAYADNDILRFNANGVDYEMSLAGVIIEFKGAATAYNAGVFTLTITSATAVLSDTPTSGYTRFPASTTAVYHCNGSQYNPIWTVNMNKAVQQLLYSSTSSAGYGYADIVIGSVFCNWTLLWLEFMEASYGTSGADPHSGAGLIPLSLVRSLGNVAAIADQYHIPIGYNPGNTTANQYIAVGYTDDSTFRLARGGSGGPIGKVKIYGIC